MGRELFLCCALGWMGAALVLGEPPQEMTFPLAFQITMALLFGTVVGIGGWTVYRILRFVLWS